MMELDFGQKVWLMFSFLSSMSVCHELERVYVGEISATEEIDFQFEINSTDVIRITTRSEHALPESPVLVVVREGSGISSWSLPVTAKKYRYTSASKTICPHNYINSSRELVSLLVGLSTPRPESLSYELEARKLEDSEFNLEFDTPMSLNVTPSASYYVKHTVDKTLESYVLEFTSPDSICMIVALQQIECPVYEDESNINFADIYLTMTKKGAIPIKTALYHSEFYVVFVVKSDDSCRGSATKASWSSQRSKQIEVRVRQSVGAFENTLAICVTLCTLTMICIIVVSATLFVTKQDDKQWKNLVDSYGTKTSDVEQKDSHLEVAQLSNNAPEDMVDNVGVAAEANLNDNQGQIVNEPVEITPLEVKEKTMAKIKLYIPDLLSKPWETTEKKYKVYYWNLIAVSLFYALPVMQLVWAFQKSWTENGDLDICFYNFLCIRPLIGLYAFNHVFSNIGFIFLGVAFLFLVRSYDKKYERRIVANKNLAMSHGAPKHFGLFYTLGIALFMEGVMSGCYHVCPNYTNFQFDAAYMYMIAAFGILRIYNMRHPDINAPSHVAHIVMSAVILLSVVGTVWNKTAFWAIFTVCYIVLMFLLSAEFYYKGQWRKGKNFTRHFLQETRETSPRHLIFYSKYPDRAVFLLVINIVNLAFMVYGLVERPSKFVSFLLSIFILNLLLYTAYYVIMKIRHGEKIGPRQWIVQIFATVSWVAALYFYFSQTSDWEQTAAESKELNEDCMLLDFYDHHGVWHFLSAMSLFLSFCILLIIDDGLDCVHQSKIVVF